MFLVSLVTSPAAASCTAEQQNLMHFLGGAKNGSAAERENLTAATAARMQSRSGT